MKLIKKVLENLQTGLANKNEIFLSEDDLKFSFTQELAEQLEGEDKKVLS